ncbi:hypothetical protein EUX98_g7946 [Antrodiella citrinella]|uniref:Multiple RNA-binding domain-containing protein 1 n=1 Tax=Antrodiella citrinella TaxID=2447956 RepID=A0A4S4MCK7_9APHY|nr:hypothetical protein EUX98_g7946 [Antrodiella citrinella]
MSRLLVKNLPAYLTQQRLREHFESKDGPGGTLTDVKVVLKPDGTSRRFGFVGFKTDAEAEKARKWFDRTFVGSTKINVTVVDGTKDAPVPRPNKRPRLDPSPDEDQPVEVSKKTKKIKQASSDSASSVPKNAQFEEFAKLMQPRSKKGPSWANDEELQPVASTSALPTPKPKQVVDEPESKENDAEEEPQATGLSDLDWLKRHQKVTIQAPEPAKVTVFDQSDDEDVAMPVDPPILESPQASPEDPTRSTILQTARLFLRNLSYTCTDEELMSLFKPFGEVSQVHIPLDATAKTPKGVAYVSFADPKNAVAAYEALDKKSFQGRLLHILPAVDRRGKPELVDANGKRSLKEEKNVKRKGTAGKEFNWAMLYMNSDAVVSSVADRMNVSKADILNPESDNAAVKLALAETHVIQETKTFLESHGVVLSALDGITRVARSDTTILVKNIPYGTAVEQIRELFEPHGELRHVLVPPAGTMAVVEFVHPDDGRKAFKAVAYRRLGNSIIYLEKGPIGMFIADGGNDADAPVASASGVKPVTIADSEGTSTADEPSLAGGSTLFIKNLAFATTTDHLVHAFRHLPSFAFARVQMKPDPKRAPGSNALLSMGYGFVGFKDAESAKKAMKGMQGYVLDGHALVVKFAGRGAEEEQDTGKTKSTTTKMIVKNVPFEATKKDIRELFGSHGQLKSVRLPKKFDHKSRGFAFLDFLTRREAENAYAALKHTHLLGRHLVLEWAEEAETDIDKLREKAGVGFGGGKEMPGKKRKVDLGDDDGDNDDMEL